MSVKLKTPEESAYYDQYPRVEDKIRKTKNIIINMVDSGRFTTINDLYICDEITDWLTQSGWRISRERTGPCESEWKLSPL